MCLSVMTLKNNDGTRLKDGRMWLWMTRREDDDDDCHAEDEGAYAIRCLYDLSFFKGIFEMWQTYTMCDWKNTGFERKLVKIICVLLW